jgi:hypothetical protein
MRRLLAIIGFAFFATACLALADNADDGILPPFSHYAVILERKPFGDLSKPTAPEPVPQPDQAAIEQAKEEQALARQVDMVAVNRTPRGKIAVGFIDKGAKPPRNYYLNVGESSGGFTVVEADFVEETATIEKDGVSILLKLGKGMIPKKEAGEGTETASAAPTASTASPLHSSNPSPPHHFSPQERQPPMRPMRAGIVRRGSIGAGGTTNAPGSYLETLRRRQANRDAQVSQNAEEIAKLREEIAQAAQTSKDAAAKREREINLELISRGYAPISKIELTPEEDAELVRKGALAAPE